MADLEFQPRWRPLCHRAVVLGAASGLGLASWGFCAGQAPSQPPTDVIKPLPGPADQRTFSRGTFLSLELPEVGELEWVTTSAKPPTLEISTYQSVFFTDNAGLTEHNRKESWAWFGWIDLSYVPYSTYHWTPSISLEPFALRHNRASEEDFDGQQLSFESRLDLNDAKSWWWDVSYSLWRFTRPRGGRDEYYKEGLLGTSLNWFQSLIENPSLGVFSHYGVYWHHASPSEFDRLDWQLRLGLSMQPTPRWHGLLYVQPATYEYLNDTDEWRNREDFNFTAGASLYWTPLSQLSLGAELVWTGNKSSADSEDYEVVNPILGLYGSIRF